jgi:hypothetical protein
MAKDKRNNDAFNQFIGPVLKTIDELEAELLRKKLFVNDACLEHDLPPRFTDLNKGSRPTISTIRRDQFHGRPMATASREYLEMRGPSDKGGLGAASVNEIYEALLQGGYKFETKNDLNAKRGLREALSKNTITFRRVGEAYGLLEWYPKPPRLEKKPKQKKIPRKKRGRPNKDVVLYTSVKAP